MNDLPFRIPDPRESLTGYAQANLMLQGYCLTMENQPYFDVQDFSELSNLAEAANNGIKVAKTRASTFLTHDNSAMQAVIVNLQRLFSLKQQLTQALTPSSSVQSVQGTLEFLVSQTEGHRASCDRVAGRLHDYRTLLSADHEYFAGITDRINAQVKGDNGSLEVLRRQIAELDTSIDQNIAIIAGGSLAIVGGAIIIGIGVGSALVVGPWAKAVVVAGVTIAGAGIAGVTTASIFLGEAQKAKADAIRLTHHLDSQVRICTAMEASVGNLSTQARNAQSAAQAMSNAWGNIGTDLDDLLSKLSNKNLQVPALHFLLQRSVNTAIDNVLEQASRMRTQTETPQSVIDTGRPVSELTEEFTRRLAG